MNAVLNFIFIASAVIVLSSCSPKSGSSIRAQNKSNPNPQVTDLLKGKSTVEKLNMKYGGENGEIKATCALTSEKVSQQQAPQPHAEVESASSIKPPGFIPPIQYPEQDVVVFDLRSQAEVDKDLSQSVEVFLEHEQNEHLVKAKITFEPLKIEEGVTVNVGRAKYVMKHSPVLTYQFSLEVQGQTVPAATAEKIQVYEKVLGKNLLAQTQIGQEQFKHFLSCTLDTVVNDTNEELAREFQAQWRCVDCAGPQATNVQ